MNHESQTKRREFADQLSANHSKIYSYIYCLVRDLSDTDDLMQQTSLVLWKKFSTFDTTRDFTAWAIGIARFEVANFLRSRGRSRLYFSDDLNLILAEAQTDRSQEVADARREALNGCMEQLRDRDRDIVLSCYADENGIVKTANELGRKTQSIYNTLRRIRQGLLACIDQKMKGLS